MTWRIGAAAPISASTASQKTVGPRSWRVFWSKLYQRSREAGGKPRSIIAKFLNYQEKDNILRLAIQANKTNSLLYEGHKIFISADMSSELYQKRKKYAVVKKQLWEKRIPFTFRFPAELRVKWKDEEIIFSSAEEAAKFVENVGSK